MDVVEAICEAHWNAQPENATQRWATVVKFWPDAAEANRRYMKAALAVLSENVSAEMVEAGEYAFDQGWHQPATDEWRKNLRNAIAAALRSTIDPNIPSYPKAYDALLQKETEIPGQ